MKASSAILRLQSQSLIWLEKGVLNSNSGHLVRDSGNRSRDEQRFRSQKYRGYFAEAAAEDDPELASSIRSK
jgi:hypothetical protein